MIYKFLFDETRDGFHLRVYDSRIYSVPIGSEHFAYTGRGAYHQGRLDQNPPAGQKAVSFPLALIRTSNRQICSELLSVLYSNQDFALIVGRASFSEFPSVLNIFGFNFPTFSLSTRSGEFVAHS